MAVVRKIKIYDVWAGSGSPVASEYHGVTIETWGSRQVAVMTIAEGGSRLGADWDSGFSEKSDMRYYPRPVSGNGGTITLINSGRWFQDFESSGYDVRGCRVERTWTGNIATVPLSDHFVSDVKIGVNEISLSLGLIDTTVDSLVTGKYKGVQVPFVAGKNENVELVKVGGEEIPLFGGMTFRNANNDNPVRQTDQFGAPLQLRIYATPTDTSFPKETGVLPDEFYCRVASGHGQDNVYNVITFSFVDTGYFECVMDSVFGAVTTDSFPTGIEINYATGTDMSNVSVFSFFTLDQSFLIGENTTITNLTDSTNPVALKTVENGVLTVVNQTGTPQIQSVDWDFNVNGYWPDQFAVDPFRRSLSGYRVTDDKPHFVAEWGSAQEISEPDRSQKYRLFSGSSDYLYHISGVALQTVSVPEYLEGLSFDMKMSTQVTTGFKGMVNQYVKILCYAEYAPENGWSGQTKRVKILETVVQFEIRKTEENPLPLYQVYVTNTSGETYTPQVSGLQNCPFDERTVVVDSYLTLQKNIRGVERFKFSNIDEFSKPTKIYSYIVSEVYSSTGESNSVATVDLDLEIFDLAIFGKESGKQGSIEKLIGTVESTAITNIGQVITHFAGKQDFGKFQTVTVPVYTNTKKARGYISDKDQLKTSVALAKALREAWAIGYVNRDKEYVVKDISGYVGIDIEVPDSHKFYTPDGFELDSDAISYNYEELPTGGTITYGNGKTIVVTDADKANYSTSYVVGVTDASRAKFLWDRCHAIYTKTGLLQDVRSDVAKLEWLYEESAALEYFENLLEWNGSPQYVILDNDLDFVRKIIEATFTVAAIDTSVSGVLWNIGDPCRVFIAGITDTEYSGIVTGIAYNAKEYSANVSVRVAELEQAPNTIIETGNPLDKTYIETGSTLIKTIKEVGVK